MEAKEKIQEILTFIEQRQEKTCKFIEYVRIIDREEWVREDGKETHKKQKELFMNFGPCKASFFDPLPLGQLQDIQMINVLHYALFDILPNPIPEQELEQLAAKVIVRLFTSMEGKSSFMANTFKVYAQHTANPSESTCFIFEYNTYFLTFTFKFTMSSLKDEAAVRIAAFILGVEYSQPESDYDKRLKFWG